MNPHRCRYVEQKARLYMSPDELNRAITAYHQSLAIMQQPIFTFIDWPSVPRQLHNREKEESKNGR